MKIISYSAWGINERVIVRHVNTSSYHRFNLPGTHGVIKKYSSGKFGVLLDGIRNPASREGLFWIYKSGLKFVEEEREETKMAGFNYVAIVNLLDDYNKKDYGFALYDEDYKLLTRPDMLVVTNARGKDNRVLGTIKNIMTVEEYGKGVTAQVVGVVNMDGYIARVNEENRLKELAKKKAAIEKELEAEISRRKTVEFYEEMAAKYTDNPRLAELVAELKELGV